MKIAFSYKHVALREPVEAAAAHFLVKLERLLQSYSPDLLKLHGGFEKHPRKEEYSLSLNLSLPTGVLHATGTGPDARSSVKQAFYELEGQVKKHQSRLRKDYEWKRKRAREAILK
ncbi:MAG TPA: HPF/RaiA family ribosome-associated protein [Candidatus Dormibacteraeota bacterium]|nr:HPF/RaiA family ribosome-associated protein [Candidatus Dormibacteraeota bacterium]